MFGGCKKNYIVKLEQNSFIVTQKNNSESSNCGMALKTSSRKQKTFAYRFVPVLSESLSSFIPLSLKIPIDDGYHESISLTFHFL